MRMSRHSSRPNKKVVWGQKNHQTETYQLRALSRGKRTGKHQMTICVTALIRLPDIIINVFLWPVHHVRKINGHSYVNHCYVFILFFRPATTNNMFLVNELFICFKKYLKPPVCAQVLAHDLKWKSFQDACCLLHLTGRSQSHLYPQKKPLIIKRSQREAVFLSLSVYLFALMFLIKRYLLSSHIIKLCSVVPTACLKLFLKEKIETILIHKNNKTPIFISLDP